MKLFTEDLIPDPPNVRLLINGVKFLIINNVTNPRRGGKWVFGSVDENGSLHFFYDHHFQKSSSFWFCPDA